MGKEHEEYWQKDEAVGEGQVGDERFSIRMRLHTSEERYDGGVTLIPLSQSKGWRTYLHARPYILVPEITVQVGLYVRGGYRIPKKGERKFPTSGE